MNKNTKEPESIYKRLVDKVKRMTTAERVQTLVDAGIIYPDGTLTEFYRDNTPEQRPRKRKSQP